MEELTHQCWVIFIYVITKNYYISIHKTTSPQRLYKFELKMRFLRKRWDLCMNIHNPTTLLSEHLSYYAHNEDLQHSTDSLLISCMV